MAQRRALPLFLDPDETDILPNMVWIPIQLPRFGGNAPDLALRETVNGTLTLPVYSSLEKLQQCHGAYGHALQFPSSELESLRRLVGFATVAMDMSIPPELRLPDWDDDEAEWPAAGVDTEPGVVWIPCRSVGAGGQQVRVEMHPNDDGEVVLPAFTSRDLLAAGCGEHQPAAAFRIDDLAEIAADSGADVIAYNPTVRASARHTQTG